MRPSFHDYSTVSRGKENLLDIDTPERDEMKTPSAKLRDPDQRFKRRLRTSTLRGWVSDTSDIVRTNIYSKGGLDAVQLPTYLAVPSSIVLFPDYIPSEGELESDKEVPVAQDFDCGLMI
jgi:hypothetical protein